MKKKMLVLIGVAVCAMLLASPVLASAGYLKIYGNANGDEVLDMRDVTYIKLAIFGKKAATDFADANYDGKISMLDVGQTKLIILGKEKELTLVDQADRTVTVPRPIERVILADTVDGARIFANLHATDKVVAINEYAYGWALNPDRGCTAAFAAPELRERPSIGSYAEPNLELILSLKPDLILSYVGAPEAADTIQEKTDIPVVCFGYSPAAAKVTRPIGAFNIPLQALRLAGTILETEEAAEELISYVNEKIEGITEVTSEIPEEEKPKVFFNHPGRHPPAAGTMLAITFYPSLDLAGGINVASEVHPIMGGGTFTISKEQVILWNPDIIIQMGGLKTDPNSAKRRDELLADPDLQTINAIKNRKVYHSKGYGVGGWDFGLGVTDVYYMAKLFHPDKFEDLNVEKECNEILERFYGVDDLYTLILDKYYDFYRWE
jgi:iron complex transport system substrate-binding protein